MLSTRQVYWEVYVTHENTINPYLLFIFINYLIFYIILLNFDILYYFYLILILLTYFFDLIW